SEAASGGLDNSGNCFLVLMPIFTSAGQTKSRRRVGVAKLPGTPPHFVRIVRLVNFPEHYEKSPAQRAVSLLDDLLLPIPCGRRLGMLMRLAMCLCALWRDSLMCRLKRCADLHRCKIASGVKESRFLSP